MLKTDNYIFLDRGQSSTIILLHGFAHSCENILPFFDKSFLNYNIIALNGPIKLRQGFAWYYYDTKNDQYSSSIEETIHYIALQLGKLLLHNQRLIAIGHSQGGFMAPLLQDCFKIDLTIGMSCFYPIHRFHKYKNLYSLFDPFDSILIKENKGQEYNDHIDLKIVGNILKFPRLGHQMHIQYIEKIQQILNQNFNH